MLKEYNINGSKIIVIRKEEEYGTTICENLINALKVTANKVGNNDGSKEKK